MMTVRWLGQSGYAIAAGGTRLLLDPYLSDAVERVAGRPRLVPAPLRPQQVRADAVICTHDHLDHLDVDAAAAMPAGTRFLTTAGGAETLRRLGQTQVQTLAVGQTVQVGAITVKAVFARHTVEAFGVVLRAQGHTLYFSGDTLLDERLFAVAQEHPQISFLCINGQLGNMDAQQAAAVAVRIGAPVNVPNHYGMFASNTADPAAFTRCVPGGCALELDREYTVAELLALAKKNGRAV